MDTRSQSGTLVRSIWGAAVLAGCGFVAAPVHGACPAGQVELLPNVRALPARDIAMADASSMKFSATSWNSGDGVLLLVPRSPYTDPGTGQLRQPVDQRISCSGGATYDRPSGNAEYHPEHNHVHYNDYANYILEQDTASPQNPRKGSKTTFCIMDTTTINTQLSGAASAAGFAWCPTQDPNFNRQGMSIGWGDTYGAHLPGQSMAVADLPAGIYRLRHVFDPKNLIAETDESDNESCRRIEIGDGANGRYVADRGACTTPAVARIDSVSPASIPQGACTAVTIFGANLVPEFRFGLAGGTGPVPTVQQTRVDVAGNYATATLCVPRAKGKKGVGNDPVWDVVASAGFGDYRTVTGLNVLRVTP
jgi:hypothetical protein